MREVAPGTPAGGPINTERLRRLGVNEGASIHNVGQSAQACPTSFPILISREIRSRADQVAPSGPVSGGLQALTSPRSFDEGLPLTPSLFRFL